MPMRIIRSLRQRQRAKFIAPEGRKHQLPLGFHQQVALITCREVIDRLAATRKSEPDVRFGRARLDPRVD
jgi:hypothetical protein